MIFYTARNRQETFWHGTQDRHQSQRGRLGSMAYLICARKYQTCPFRLLLSHLKVLSMTSHCPPKNFQYPLTPLLPICPCLFRHSSVRISAIYLPAVWFPCGYAIFISIFLKVPYLYFECLASLWPGILRMCKIPNIFATSLCRSRSESRAGFCTCALTFDRDSINVSRRY